MTWEQKVDFFINYQLPAFTPVLFLYALLLVFQIKWDIEKMIDDFKNNNKQNIES